jgi:hypothetical protein
LSDQERAGPAIHLTTTRSLILDRGPCNDGLARFDEAFADRGEDGIVTLAEMAERIKFTDALWCLGCVPKDQFAARDRFSRLLACRYAESSLHFFESRHPTDNRPRVAIEAAREYAIDPSPARSAARDAAWDAACAAARDAASAAARDAASAAARAAACAAARAAACAAACAAAWDAAWDAASAAARDAAWDAQKRIFISALRGEIDLAISSLSSPSASPALV